MQGAYIFSVGKPDLGAESVSRIHTLGYRAGLLLSHLESTKNADKYDTVIKIDFANLDQELNKIAHLTGQVYGLIATYENYIIAKAKLAAFFNVPGISLESAMLATDKLLMRQAFLDYDKTITPDFAAISTPEEALHFSKKFGFPVIIKPTNLVKSLLVMRCNNQQELITNFTYAQKQIAGLYKKYNVFSRQPQLIIEQFMEGDMFSVAAFTSSTGDVTISPGITKLVSAQAIGRDDNYIYSRTLPARLSPELEDEIMKVSTAGIKALGLTSTAAHVELIAGNEGVKLVEIGARIGGYRPRMYQSSFDIDLHHLEVLMAIDKLPRPLTYQAGRVCSVFEIFPTKTGKFESISGLTSELLSKVDYHSIKPAPGEIVGPAKNGHKAALIAIASTTNSEEMAEIAKAINIITVKVT